MISASPSHHQLISHPTVIGGAGSKPGGKGKKARAGAKQPNSPGEGAMDPTAIRR